MLFQCPKCKKKFNRDMRLKEYKDEYKKFGYVKSLCSKFGVMVKCKKI